MPTTPTPELTPSPSPRTPRQIRATLLAIAIVAGFAELSYAVMNISAMPIYLNKSMGYGAAYVAIIGTAFLLFEGVMKGPFGILGDRVGRKWLIIGGPLISTVTALLTLLVPPEGWYWFVLLRVLDGLGAAALWPSALAMMADVIEEEKRSQAMSLFNVTYLIGIALGPFLGGGVNDLTAHFLPAADPRRASFYLISVLFLMTAGFAWWRIPDVRPAGEHAQSELEAGFSFSALFQSLRQIPEMLVMAFVTFLGIGMVMLIIKLFADAEYGLSETQFGALLLLPCLVIALASVPLGTLGDKIGRVKAIRFGIGMCAISMSAQILIKSQIALVIGGSLIGVGFVIAFPNWMAYISSNCDPRQRGAIMGAIGTAQGVGAMIGAPLGGWLYEHAHLHVGFLPWLNSHYAPFLGCALMLLIAFFLAMTTIREAEVCVVPAD